MSGSHASRRSFLRLAALSAGSLAVPAGPAAASLRATEARGPRVAPVDARTLVIVELQGGNDGLSTVVPIESGRYHDLRPTLALSGDDVRPWVDGWGLHHHLGGLRRFGLAAVQGLGARSPDLSHFEMQARWWAGSPDGSGAATGFLGRVCDQLSPATDDPDAPALAGVSVSSAPTPALGADHAPTASVSGPDGYGLTASGDRAHDAATRRFLDRLAGWGPGDERLGPARRGLSGVRRITALIDGLDEVPDDRYPEEEFARQLSFAAQLIRADAGVRVLHVPMVGGAFDTHENHRETHDENMRLLASGLTAFLDDLAADGLDDRVLVATTSEFGRRAEEHGSGLDHGTASCALLLGPVEAGTHGEPPSLRKLDDDGNLVATTGFDRYYATLAAWLGVDPGSVLDEGTEPIEGLTTEGAP